jgi:LysM repeat protein
VNVKHLIKPLSSAAIPVVIISILSGCSQPKVVLQDRGEIPPAAIEPQPISVAPVAVAPAPNSTPATRNSELPAFKLNNIEPITYKVKKGDSYWKIAFKYGLTPKELAGYNNKSIKRPLRIGTILEIPPSGSLENGKKLAAKYKKSKKRRAIQKRSSHKRVVRRRRSTPPVGDGTLYTVKKGDSLWKIASRYNLKTTTLAKANNRSLKKPLRVGEKLVIPAGAKERTHIRKTSTYRKPPVNKTTKPAVTPPTETTITPATGGDDLLNDKNIDNELDDLLPQTSEENDDLGVSKTSQVEPIAKTTTPPKSVVKKIEQPTQEAPIKKYKTDDILKLDDEGAEEQDLNDLLATPVPKEKGEEITREVIKDQDLSLFVITYNVSEEEVRKLNPDLPADGKLKKGTIIKLPK